MGPRLSLVVHRSLVRVTFFAVRFVHVFWDVRFTDWLGTGDKWRKAFKKFVEHLAAGEKLLNRYADLDTIIAGLFKGAIVAVRGHLF